MPSLNHIILRETIAITLESPGSDAWIRQVVHVLMNTNNVKWRYEQYGGRIMVGAEGGQRRGLF